ncbi:MAG: N-acetylmuramoyl-L-alanine amidase-like domain-containing protein [Thermoanaerobaculia bacterium]
MRGFLASARANDALSSRTDALSASLLGRPYRVAPLTGSATVAEDFDASLDAFDCVTYVETVFAAAISSDEKEFLDHLKRLRYERGGVRWDRRNHYMVTWIRRNQRAGLVTGVPLGRREVERVRVLDAVPGLPPLTERFSCLPKRFLPGALARLSTGDLICLASTKRNLDVFHCGLVIKDGLDPRDVSLRHASRKKRAVVQENLFDFLGRNRMAGVIVARLSERGRG